MNLISRLTILFLATAAVAPAREIVISTDRTKMELRVEDDGSLTQRGYGIVGDTFPNPRGSDEMVHQFDFYPTFGDGYVLEPALQVTHADGDISTNLVVDNVETVTDPNDPNIITTAIRLKDTVQALSVTIFLRAFQREDVIQIWTKIENSEDGPVILRRFASASPMNFSKSYWLTQFSGNHMNEANMVEEKLTPGTKVLGSNLGARAHRMTSPMFLVSLNDPANDDSAYVIGSTFMWPGSFRFSFDIDSANNLHMIVGADHVGSSYYLEKGQALETPKSLWVFSTEGTGGVTRRFHDWGRKYAIRDPEKPRPVLLNNWEATNMKFDEERLVSLFDSARGTGVDIFLLDDGWFGNKYQRDDDTQGLGDWEVAKSKLPRGLGYLCEEAKKRDLGFGIWLEPEMISPKSELYEEHPDWALASPGRKPILGRNQQVLDLTNPMVRDFVWSIFENTLGPNPIQYVKWDANCCIYQPSSSYLPKDKQGNVDFDYNSSLLQLMSKFSTKFPETMAMLCSGGGGRVDYASLANFDSFWVSDNTDPMKRVFIQWGFSHFFPSLTQSAHVTHMGGRPMKFSLDVAMSGALGFDIDFSKVPPEDMDLIKRDIELYKKEIRPITANGDYHRLKSPYDHAQSAVLFAAKDKSQAVLFTYQTRDDSEDQTVRLKGLDPEKSYTIREVALREGVKSALSADGSTISGKDMMEKGLLIPTKEKCGSAVILLNAVEKAVGKEAVTREQAS